MHSLKFVDLYAIYYRFYGVCVMDQSSLKLPVGESLLCTRIIYYNDYEIQFFHRFFHAVGCFMSLYT